MKTCRHHLAMNSPNFWMIDMHNHFFGANKEDEPEDETNAVEQMEIPRWNILLYMCCMTCVTGDILLQLCIEIICHHCAFYLYNIHRNFLI